MYKIIYITFLSLLLINCTSNTIIKKPDNLIPKNQMVDVLTDMFLASGGENIKNIHLQRKVNYFPLVFEKHHIDSTQFKESNFYYVSRIDDYEEILKKVDERLQRLKKLNEEEISLQDSIKNIDNPRPIRKVKYEEE
mgnify:FL=1|jgi:hypothetical protein